MQAANAYDNEPKLSLALIIGGIAVFGLALGLSRGFPQAAPCRLSFSCTSFTSLA